MKASRALLLMTTPLDDRYRPEVWLVHLDQGHVDYLHRTYNPLAQLPVLVTSGGPVPLGSHSIDPLAAALLTRVVFKVLLQ